jgi:hypothetical protein
MTILLTARTTPAPLSLRRTEELFYEHPVEVCSHLDDLVSGYADDPAIVVVGPVGDAGGLPVPLYDGNVTLDDDLPHAGPDRLTQNASQAFVGGVEELALAAIFTRGGVPVMVQWTSSATWSSSSCESPR